MIFYLLLPLLLTLGTAFATQWSIGVSARGSLGLVAGVSLVAEALVTALAIGLAVWSLNEPSDERCPIEPALWTFAVVLIFASSICGGVVFATVIADWRRQKGVLVWHVLAAPASLLLPYVVGAAYLYWGLTCTS